MTSLLPKATPIRPAAPYLAQSAGLLTIEGEQGDLDTLMRLAEGRLGPYFSNYPIG